MKPKFEIGDKVIYKPDNYVGTINGIDRDTDGYSILYDDGEERYVHENDLEFTNPKVVFLARLQELLATFDAVINVGWNNGWQADDAEYPLIDMDVVFKDGTGFCYDNVLDRSITAENVFDYDKD